MAIYSDNPKMDTTGIRVEVKSWHTGDEPEVCTGGKIYQETIAYQQDFSKDAVKTSLKDLRETAEKMQAPPTFVVQVRRSRR